MQQEKIAKQFRTIALTLTFVFSAGSALAINKCTHDGKITYTDLPCPEDTASSSFTAQIIPPNDSEAAKKRHISDKKKLNQLNQQKIKEEKHQKREERAIAHQIKRNKEHEFKCSELDLKRKSAQQQYAKIKFNKNSEKVERARTRVKQTENKFTHYCKS